MDEGERLLYKLVGSVVGDEDGMQNRRDTSADLGGREGKRRHRTRVM